MTGKKGCRPIPPKRGGDRGRPPVFKAYDGVVPPARPSRAAAVEPCGPLCHRLRSGRVVAPRIVLNDCLRWGQTLFVAHLWAGWQRRGQPHRGRDAFGAERGSLCIRVRACGRHRRQRPPLQRGRGDVVRACFVAAAVVIGGRVASREGGHACPRAFPRPPLSLAATAAPCARTRCSWRPSFSVLSAGHDHFWTRVRRKAGCLTFLAAALCTSGRLSLAAHEASDCVRTGRCGSMVLPAPRPISKTEHRRGLRQFCRMCRRTLGVGDDHPLCAPSCPCPWAARTRPISEAPPRAAGAEAPAPQAVHPPCLGPLPSGPPSPHLQDPRPSAWRPPPTRPPSPSRQGPGPPDRRPGPCRPPSPPLQGPRSSEWWPPPQRPPSPLRQSLRPPEWRPPPQRPPSPLRQGLRPPDWRPPPQRPPSPPRQGLRPPDWRPGPCRPPGRPVKVHTLPTGGRRRSGRRACFFKACVPPIGGVRPGGCRAPLAHASGREAGSHRRAHLEQARPVTKSGRHHRFWGAPLVKAHLGPPGGRPRRGRQVHSVKVHPLQPGGRRPSGRRVPQARRVKDQLR